MNGHTSTRIHTRIHTCMYIRMSIRVYIRVYIRAYVRVHTCIHTSTHKLFFLLGERENKESAFAPSCPSPLSPAFFHPSQLTVPPDGALEALQHVAHSSSTALLAVRLRSGPERCRLMHGLSLPAFLLACLCAGAAAGAAARRLRPPPGEGRAGGPAGRAAAAI